MKPKELCNFIINIIGIKRMSRLDNSDDLCWLYHLYKIGFTRKEIQALIDGKL